MRIDLHTHSSVSDGTESPGRAAARPRGPPGWTSSRSPTTTRPPAGRPPRRRGRAGLTVVPGMELSCRWFPDDQPPISVHLLAYLFDPHHPGLRRRARAAARRAARARRADRRRAGRRRLPGVLGPDRRALRRAAWSAARTSPGRWWTAGVVDSVDHAFATLLHHRSPYYVAEGRHRRPGGHRAGPRGRRGAGVRPRAGHQAGPGRRRRRGRRDGRGRPAGPGGRPPRPHAPTSARTCAAWPPTSA